MSDAFTTNSEEFQKLVPEFTNGKEPMKDYERLVKATEGQFKKLNAMQDSDGKETTQSPTSLARKELIDTRTDAVVALMEEYGLQQTLYSAVYEDVMNATAFASVLREHADFIDFLGDLNVQHLRNSKFVGSTETDDDAVAQREVVSKLIENIKVFAGVVEMFTGEDPTENREIPTLRGNRVGTQSSGERKSSKFPVVESNMIFTIITDVGNEDEESTTLPPQTSISEAVIHHLFPALGAASYGMDIQYSILKALKEENSKWTSPGEETVLVFESDDGNVVYFTVVIQPKNETE